MRGTILYGPRDIRFEGRETPRIIKPTDAIIRISATCVCGSDLCHTAASNRLSSRPRWVTSTAVSSRDIGSEVTSIKPGQFVIGSFFGSDNTCPNCQVGYQSSLAAENHTELGFWRVSTNSINRLAKSTEASRG